MDTRNTAKQIRFTHWNYEATQKTDESELTAAIIAIFQASRSNYGTRKIKQELAKIDMYISRRRIGRIMRQEGLVSTYTTAQFHPQGYLQQSKNS